MRESGGWVGQPSQADARPGRPLLVLVGGAPAVGKTTLADRLGTALGLPVLSRDVVKALLADAIGEPLRGDHSFLRRTHVPLYFSLLEYLIKSGPGLVAEAAFHRDLVAESLQPILPKARAVVVHCSTADGVNVRRFAERHRSGVRHAAHPDAEHLAAIARDPAAWDPYVDPPPLGLPTLRVDTSDGYAPSFGEIVAFVEAVRAGR